MARISLEDKIKKQEEAVFKAKDKYEAELKELDRLLTKRRELESKELVKAFEKSKKSLKEILEFMSGNEDDEASQAGRPFHGPLTRDFFARLSYADVAPHTGHAHRGGPA